MKFTFFRTKENFPLHFRIESRLVIFAQFLVFAAVAGCGSDNPLGRQEIRGSISLDSQVVKKGRIAFTPRSPQGVSSGAKIVDGEYLIPESKGLPPGPYLVQIYAPKTSKVVEEALARGEMPDINLPPSAILGIEVIPPKYNIRSTELVEVSAEGSNRFDYSIESR